MRRSTIFSAILALAVVFSFQHAALCSGPNADVTALFNKVAAAYRSFKSCSFILETVAASRTSHQTETITTTIILVKPNKLAADLNGKQGRIRVVADGKYIFTTSSQESTKYMKAPDIGFDLMVQALKDAGGCGIGLLGVLLTDHAAQTKIVHGNQQYVRRGPDTTISGSKCDVVNAQTSAGTNSYTYMFAFGKADHFLRRVTVSDPAHPTGPMFMETYTNVKINPSINEAMFRFSPPKGAVAIDPTAAPKNYDQRIKVGAAPIPITGVDLNGKPVSLAQYKGKVLLVDFWATWCGPCVHELPNVIAAYGKYHARGFDVIGITLDKQDAKQVVLNFVKTNRMPWRQVFDGKYWAAANAAAYDIHAIPFTMLIGRDGKIAAVGARGPLLGPAIEAALKHK